MDEVIFIYRQSRRKSTLTCMLYRGEAALPCLTIETTDIESVSGVIRDIVQAAKQAAGKHVNFSLSTPRLVQQVSMLLDMIGSSQAVNWKVESAWPLDEIRELYS